MERGEDVTEILKKDHRKVEELFDKMSDASEPEQQQLLQQIILELQTHSDAEEETLYRQAMRFDSTRFLAEHSEVEHAQINSLLGELSEMQLESGQKEEEFKSLRERVKDHVEEEETELFPRLREVLSEEDLQELGAQLLAAKQKILKMAS